MILKYFFQLLSVLYSSSIEILLQLLTPKSVLQHCHCGVFSPLCWHIMDRYFCVAVNFFFNTLLTRVI